MTDYYILLIYPALLLGIMIFGAKIAKRGTFVEGYWGLDDSKKLQAVAAVCVVLHHLTQYATEYGRYYKGPITFFSDMGIFFTSIFFFFSGYGLITSYLNKENYLDGFLAKRLPTVLFPVLLTNIIYVVLNGADRINTLTDIATSIIGFTLINTNAWFMVEIIILYMAFYLCFKYVKNKDVAFILLGVTDILMVVIGLLLHHDSTAINGHWFMGEWWYNTTLVFLMGMIFAKYKKSVTGFFERTYKVALPMAILLWVELFALERYVDKIWGYYIERHEYIDYSARVITLAAQLASCIAFMIMILLALMKIKTGNRLLELMSVVSMELYLVHDLVMQRIGERDGIPPALIYGIIIACSYIFATLLHAAMHFVMEIWREFRGGKYEDYYGVEGKVRNERKKRIIKIIIAVYVMTFLFCVGSGVYYLVKITVLDKNEMEREIEVIRNAQPGDEVIYGNFVLSKDEAYEDNDEVEWIVIDKNEDEALLICKEALVGNCYYYNYATIGWKDSSIRYMLNEYFIYELFTAKELDAIVADPELGDKFFLLDEEQIIKYFPDEESRMFAPTKLSRYAGGFNVNSSTICASWWIRLDEPSIMVPVVDYWGKIDKDREYVNVPSIAVRPAMWVSFN